MSVNDTLKFLAGRQRFGWKLGLDNIKRLMQTFDDPHLRMNCLHVAGTNGKGSTCAILESIMRHAGYKTGLYTSPHLLCVNERIRINGEPISMADLSRYISMLYADVQASGSTYFETLTAAALACFAENDVDIAILETGLGGRYDATNVVEPLLSVITDIDLDHQEHLGEDRKAIAYEKAGIIKRGSPCLLQANPSDVVETVETVAKQLGCPLMKFEELCSVELGERRVGSSEFALQFAQGEVLRDLHLSLPGKIQVRNAALAICAARTVAEMGFHVPQHAIYNGLLAVRWQGRLQRIQDAPPIIVDVAHNPPAMLQLMRSFHEFYPGRRLRVMVGLLNDKNHAEIAKIISETADDIYVVAPDSDRGLDEAHLVKIFRKFTDRVSSAKMEESELRELIRTLKAEDVLCVTGSHYVVGAFLKLYDAEKS